MKLKNNPDNKNNENPNFLDKTLSKIFKRTIANEKEHLNTEIGEMEEINNSIKNERENLSSENNRLNEITELEQTKIDENNEKIVSL